MCLVLFFFFQAEDGIRDAQESRGLGDVYKRQAYEKEVRTGDIARDLKRVRNMKPFWSRFGTVLGLSLIHI